MFRKILDKDIIEGVRKQDDKILNWLYDNYLQSIKNYVLKNSGSVDDVSDVFQDTIIILFKQITENQLDLTTDLKGYFYGIARNVWQAQLRKKQRNTELVFDLSDEDESEEDHSILLESIVNKAFLKLKPDEQEILNLFSQGCSYQEIAERMGLKNEVYARRKKYLSKEALIDLVKEDREYQDYLRFMK